MYAHPSFVRDHAETLSDLRKLTNNSSRRKASASASAAKEREAKLTAARSVSPSPPRMLTSKFLTPAPRLNVKKASAPTSTKPTHTAWAPINKVPLSPQPVQLEQPRPQNIGRGRLDLLTMALEQVQ
jgi:hypothetical protein